MKTRLLMAAAPALVALVAGQLLAAQTDSTTSASAGKSAPIPTGELTTLVSFAAGRPGAGGVITNSNGAHPRAPLILASDGSFYGTTWEGGPGGGGTVFHVATNGRLATVVSFAGGQTNVGGANPYAGLTLGADGNFYGTTAYGGKHGKGTAFRLGPIGAFTSLVSFDGDSGIRPNDLTLGPDGILYGITHAGGPENGGAAFKVTTNALLRRLVFFDNSSGIRPNALRLGADGNFYSTTSNGGPGTCGTVFKLTPNGALTTVAWFNRANGAYPSASLALGRDGAFYGTTFKGGDLSANRGAGYGTIFKVTTNGVLTRLVAFKRADGAHPYAALTLGTDGCFYGTTDKGGARDKGTVFQVTPGGALITLVAFDGSNGAEPNALTLGKDGHFYGTTRFGGTAGNGTVFRLTVSTTPAAPLATTP